MVVVVVVVVWLAVDTGAQVTVKLLLPSRVCGGVIGKSGEKINSIRKASGSRVELQLTGSPAERVVRPRPCAAGVFAACFFAAGLLRAEVCVCVYGIVCVRVH